MKRGAGEVAAQVWSRFDGSFLAACGVCSWKEGPFSLDADAEQEAQVYRKWLPAEEDPEVFNG